jgi:hypothetical protein
MPFFRFSGSEDSLDEPKSMDVVSIERITFYTLQMIFLLATIGLAYWIIAPAAFTAWSRLSDALSTEEDRLSKPRNPAKFWQVIMDAPDPSSDM